jgi:hypothetical protein
VYWRSHRRNWGTDCGIDLDGDGEPKYAAWLWLFDGDVKERVGVGVMGT